jgi:hypothetical protein
MRIGVGILTDRTYPRGPSNGVKYIFGLSFQFTKITKVGFETTHNRTDSYLYDYIVSN